MCSYSKDIGSATRDAEALAEKNSREPIYSIDIAYPFPIMFDVRGNKALVKVLHALSDVEDMFFSIAYTGYDDVPFRDAAPAAYFDKAIKIEG